MDTQKENNELANINELPKTTTYKLLRVTLEWRKHSDASTTTIYGLPEYLDWIIDDVARKNNLTIQEVVNGYLFNGIRILYYIIPNLKHLEFGRDFISQNSSYPDEDMKIFKGNNLTLSDMDSGQHRKSFRIFSDNKKQVEYMAKTIGMTNSVIYCLAMMTCCLSVNDAGNKPQRFAMVKDFERFREKVERLVKNTDEKTNKIKQEDLQKKDNLPEVGLKFWD